MARKLPEHELARQWRERMGLSRAALGKLIGYSLSAVSDYETGKRRSTGAAIGANEWLRYRLACAAITAHIEFDWTSCRVEIDGRQA
jgi:transcriptional regulator with XRE-family HTH domain